MARRKNKALLVVDVQNDFCPNGALAVPRGDEVVEPLNRMVSFARSMRWVVFASRDWHPRQTSHFNEFGGIWPVHCVQGTQGAEFHPLLDTRDAIVISKATRPDEDGYSPFDGAADYGESLLKILSDYRIEELYIGGLATDYCVKAAVLDGLKHDFKVYLLTDACRGVDLGEGDVARALEEMRAAGAVFTTTEEVIGQNA